MNKSNRILKDFFERSKIFAAAEITVKKTLTFQRRKLPITSFPGHPTVLLLELWFMFGQENVHKIALINVGQLFYLNYAGKAMHKELIYNLLGSLQFFKHNLGSKPTHQ